MTTPDEVLRAALVTYSNRRRTASREYLNQREGGRETRARWLSDVGFLLEAPFSYERCHLSHLRAVNPGERRDVTRIVLVPYGLRRDYLRLTSTAPEELRVHLGRQPGRTGRAAYPGSSLAVPLHGAADLEDDTSCLAKTQHVLAMLRDPGQGPGYHAVIGRNGAVYINAPLDFIVSPVPDTDAAVCVAMESAAVRVVSSGEVLEAPWTAPQLVSLSVMLNKLGTAYMGQVPDAVGNPGIQYVVSERDSVPSAVLRNLVEGATGPAPLDYESVRPAAVLQRLGEELSLDPATELFRRTPPTESSRGRVRNEISRRNTAGANSLILGAYADIAAQDRASDLAARDRRAVFVRRAQTSHREAEEAAAEAARLNPTRLEPVIPEAQNVGPHAYDYATGTWGSPPYTY